MGADKEWKGPAQDRDVSFSTATISSLQRQLEKALKDWFGPGVTWTEYGDMVSGGERIMGPHTTFSIPGKRPLTKEDMAFLEVMYLTFLDVRVVEVRVEEARECGSTIRYGWYSDVIFVQRHLSEDEQTFKAKVDYKKRGCPPKCNKGRCIGPKEAWARLSKEDKATNRMRP